MSGNQLFSVHNLTKTYGEREALRGVSLEAQSGEFIGLIGANGSGKTTLLRCLAGIIRPTTGKIAVDSCDMLRQSVSAKKAIGWAIESELLPAGLTGLQIIEFVAGIKLCASWREELAPLAEMLDMQQRLDDRIQTYSQGMRAKIGVLCALIGQPKLVLLDESLSTLDPVATFRIKKFLFGEVTQGRWTVVLSTHAIEMVENIASRVVILHDGLLAADWSRDEIDRRKSESGKSLEEILVDRITKK